MTTTPSIRTVSSIRRMASTAAPSADSFSPSPTQRAAAIAPYSVTRTSSIARLRSGRAPVWSGLRCRGFRPGSDAGGFGLHVLRLAAEAPVRYEKGAHQPHEVADLDRDVDGDVLVAAGPAQDDPVEQDQRERDHADDHRDLAGAPAERVPAGDDVGEHERRDARREQRPAHEGVGLPAGEAAVVDVPVRQLDLRVRVAAALARRLLGDLR